jgi:hypothetical protein
MPPDLCGSLATRYWPFINRLRRKMASETGSMIDQQGQSDPQANPQVELI